MTANFRYIRCCFTVQTFNKFCQQGDKIIMNLVTLTRSFCETAFMFLTQYNVLQEGS